MFYWYQFSEKVIRGFKDKGYNFNHTAENNIIAIANKLDMSNDFYIKHNMCAVEGKLKAIINKKKTNCFID